MNLSPMNPGPVFFVATRRLHRKRTQVASSPAPVGPLNLISATVVDFSGADAVVKLVFDCGEDDPIVDIESAVGTNWTAVIEGYAFGGNTPLELSAFNIVMLYMGNQGEALGPNVVSYAGDPADIVTASGRSLAGFADRALE